MNFKKLFLIVFLLGSLGAGIWFLVVRMEREEPALTFENEPEFIGKSTHFSFTAADGRSGLRQIRVWMRQGQKTEAIHTEDFSSGDWLARGGTASRKVDLLIEPKGLSFSDGAATLIVAAQDNSLWGFKGNSVFREFPVTVDTIAPRIELLSRVHNVSQGGTGLVVYRLSEKPESTSVNSGEKEFSGYPERSGGDSAYLAYFVVPPDAPSDIRFSIAATDRAGNETLRSFPVRVLKKKSVRDTIRVSDGFLKRKIPEFRDMDPSLDSNPVKAYLTVNREWRQRNHETFRELCRESNPDRLWSGPFLQMKNTKNMAPYAVRRTYVYGGKVIDKQVHLGLDLASTAGAPVPAANTGIVVFAENLGIYGETVLIDHGQGVFSSYSHLNGISVNAGDRVERGETIGASGQTGMAGGDHLHFSILVSGEFVSPVEWLDDHWIEDNVRTKLEILSSSAL